MRQTHCKQSNQKHYCDLDDRIKQHDAGKPKPPGDDPDYDSNDAKDDPKTQEQEEEVEIKSEPSRVIKAYASEESKKEK
jgi:hypothetical protein